MSNEKVKQDKKIVIGNKQTVKALKSGDVYKIIIANDADPKLTLNIIRLAQEQNVQVQYADSMKKLGKACGIDVGAAAVAILN